MRRFYLHKRAGIYYAELVDPETGKKLPAKSTGERNEDEARDVVRDWLRSGVPASPTRSSRQARNAFTIASVLAAVRTEELTSSDAEKIAQALKARGLLLSYVTPGTQGAELFNDFLTRFWTYDKSPYVAEKLAHGHRMTREHCQHSLGRARLHWFPVFKGKRLADLTKADIKAFSTLIADGKHFLAPATLNRVLLTGTGPLRWAYENGLIASDITAGLVTYSGEGKKRGVLSPEEAKDLFALPWDNNLARIGNLVAATTGLRLGEIRALRSEDIDEFILHVRHAWTEKDGLKTTKTGESRRVPLLPSIRVELLALLAESPHGPEGYIFWDVEDASRPCSYSALAYNLRKMLIRLRVGVNPNEDERRTAEEYWDKRAVTFHSWRHYYSARMADRLEARTVMLATGHRTQAVFDAYAEHALESDMARLAATTADVFSSILPFKTNSA
jgi:integrase